MGFVCVCVGGVSSFPRRTRDQVPSVRGSHSLGVLHCSKHFYSALFPKQPHDVSAITNCNFTNEGTEAPRGEAPIAAFLFWLQPFGVQGLEPRFGLEEAWTTTSMGTCTASPEIRGNTGLEKANSRARGDGSPAPSPSEAAQWGGPGDSAAGAAGWPPSSPQDLAQRLRFLLGLREVSPSAGETAAAPPS